MEAFASSTSREVRRQSSATPRSLPSNAERSAEGIEAFGFVLVREDDRLDRKDAGKIPDEFRDAPREVGGAGQHQAFPRQVGRRAGGEGGRPVVGIGGFLPDQTRPVGAVQLGKGVPAVPVADGRIVGDRPEGPEPLGEDLPGFEEKPGEGKPFRERPGGAFAEGGGPGFAGQAGDLVGRDKAKTRRRGGRRTRVDRREKRPRGEDHGTQDPSAGTPGPGGQGGADLAADVAGREEKGGP